MGETLTLGAPSDSGGSGEWTPIPNDSVVDAVVHGVKKIEKPFKDRETGEPIFRIEFQFKVTGGQFDGRVVKGDTSTAFVKHPECKLFMWIQEILGQELPDNFELDTDLLIGKPVKIQVKAEEKERRDGNGTWWLQQVKDVLKSDQTIAAAQQGSAFNDFDDEPF